MGVKKSRFFTPAVLYESKLMHTVKKFKRKSRNIFISEAPAVMIKAQSRRGKMIVTLSRNVLKELN